MQMHTHTDARPRELNITIINGKIVDASWITSTESEQGGFDNLVSNCGNISIPANSDEATRLLMKCRYPRADKECVILRKAADDPERIEHETYYAKVVEYVGSLNLGE